MKRTNATKVEKEMKIAIIGFGGMGSYHEGTIIPRYNEYARSLEKAEESIEVCGTYDISSERQDFAAKKGLNVFKNIEDVWADKSIEAVLIATPNDLHLPYAIEAAKHGKNIISEKPAGLHSGEVEEMYAAAKKYGVVFTPHQNRRWDKDFLSVKNIYDNSITGSVYRIESRVMGSHGIPGAWRRVDKQGGGMMLDWGVHLIDQMLQMVKEHFKSVLCDYSYIAGEEVDDGFDLEVEFESGLLYRIVVDTNTFIELPRWQVYGIDGTATVSDWRAENVEGKIVCCRERVDVNLKGVTAGNGLTKTMAARNVETVDIFPMKIVDASGTEFYENFVHAVRFGEPTTVKREEVLNVYKIMESAKLSAKNREVIKF